MKLHRLHDTIALLLFITAGILMISSCSKDSRHYDKEDVVAQVGDKVLLKNDLDNIIPEYQLMQDSSLYVQAFVQSWVRDNMLIEDARSEYKDNAEINKLVEEYRESLILHRYKKALIEDKMDSIITEDELRKYYQQNTQNFYADEPLYQVKLIRCSRLHPMLEDFRKAWESDKPIAEYEDIAEFCSVGNTRCFTDTALWVTKSFIENQLPAQLLSKVNFNQTRPYDMLLNEDNYFFMIREIVKKGEPAPFSSVKEKIYAIVFNNKKTSLSKELTQKIYEEGIEKGWIKINIK